MKVLVCGGRDYQDYSKVCWVLGHTEPPISLVIHGAAPGADSLAAKWAVEQGIPTDAYVADWDKYGKAAGPIRNRVMLELGKPERVIAFPGGKGTADMVFRARRANVPVTEIGE